MSWADGVTIRGARPDGSVEQIRFGPTLRTRLMSVLGAPVGLLVGALVFMLAWHVGPSAVFTVLPGWQGVLVVMCGAALVPLFSNSGVVLTPAALVVKRSGRADAVVPWTSIDGLTLSPVLSVTGIVVHCSDRRRIRLHCPVGGFLGDPAFEAKFHTIGTWWTAGKPGGARPSQLPA